MLTRQELEGQWNQIKGQLQERWGALTEDELQQAKGNTTQLVGVIQQRTGESRRVIEDYLEELVSTGQNVAQKTADKAREYTQQAGEFLHQSQDKAHEKYDQVAARMQEGLSEAQECVRRNPMESVAVAFGAGLIAGVVTALVLKSR